MTAFPWPDYWAKRARWDEGISPAESVEGLGDVGRKRGTFLGWPSHIPPPLLQTPFEKRVWGDYATLAQWLEGMLAM